MRSQNIIATVIHWIARVLAIITTLLILFIYVTFNIGPVFDDITQAFDLRFLLPLILGVFVLAGLIVSWWKERIGGILFITVFIYVIVMPIVFGMATSEPVHVSFFQVIFPRPFTIFKTFQFYPLVVGILFLISNWMLRKAQLGHHQIF